MNLGPPSAIFSRMGGIPQAVINEMLWLPETREDDRVLLLCGKRPSQARVNMLATRAAQRQRDNAAGKAMARALLSLVKE